ncbi:transglutaminase family protein [Sphingomonas oligophenolica]|uniref:Transglutaminase family protein n=1 Tax=Sphingomonas oligophenolica TaxID=301154 RepID=A0A502CKD3_9SPHN|nr:transglutaminase family protein [Sphingomonas oligophenolica]TPG13074.1 transglutaminase family protein [Sphingomonas oligophenolica]
MRLAIDHRTLYRFSAPQRRLVQMLRMTPQNHHDQTVASWRIDVDCDATMRDAHDGFGNATTMLYVAGPIDAIEISVTGEVVTSHSSGELHGTNEVFPAALFLRATAATRADPAIARFAEDTAGGRATTEALHRIAQSLHDRFAPDTSRPKPGLAAGDAFAYDTGTARDLAQIFLVAARHLGAPARYVSGYRLSDDAGLSTPHGWAEAFVAGVGWLGFDPSVGRSPDDNYVRVAVALDSTGAAAVAGARLGEADEVIEVDIGVSESQ